MSFFDELFGVASPPTKTMTVTSICMFETVITNIGRLAQLSEHSVTNRKVGETKLSLGKHNLLFILFLVAVRKNAHFS